MDAPLPGNRVGPAMRHAFYILNADREPVPCDFLTWHNWFQFPENRKIAQAQFYSFVVSTIFLGLDLTLSGVPLLYETKVFLHQEELASHRYATWDEALAGHNGIMASLAHQHGIDDHAH